MYIVLSLLVGLSDVLILICVPAVAAALILGRHRGSPTSLAPAWRTGLRWYGRLGAALLALCLLFLLDRGLAGGMDRLDYGLLTGVPTLFVAALSLYTIVALVSLSGFALLRKTTRWTGSKRACSPSNAPHEPRRCRADIPVCRQAGKPALNPGS